MIKKTKWLAKEATLRFKYMIVKDCIFCKIVSGEIKTKPILETKGVIAINDINPVSEVHVLIVPKRHIESVLTVNQEDALDLVVMFEAAQKIAKEKNLSAFRLVFNAGNYQHVPHLHMHLLAGGSVSWSKL